MLPGVVRVPGGVRGLPFAPPQRVFSSLEDYLQYRREAATMGAPILEQVGPDRFRETAGRLMSRSVREYTRNELLQMYGFE